MINKGNSNSSTFLNAFRKFIEGEVSYDLLLVITEKYGFTNVVDAFQNVNGGIIPNQFYHKDYNGLHKRS